MQLAMKPRLPLILCIVKLKYYNVHRKCTIYALLVVKKN